jgi:uncharacterized membrane protein
VAVARGLEVAAVVAVVVAAVVSVVVAEAVAVPVVVAVVAVVVAEGVAVVVLVAGGVAVAAAVVVAGHLPAPQSLTRAWPRTSTSVRVIARVCRCACPCDQVCAGALRSFL